MSYPLSSKLSGEPLPLSIARPIPGQLVLLPQYIGK